MNERIRELTEQAFFETEYDDVQNLPETMERFAELIIRECISISTKVDKNPYIPDGDQAKKIIRELKQHFGIEE